MNEGLAEFTTEALLEEALRRCNLRANESRADRSIGREFSLAATAIEDAQNRSQRGYKALGWSEE